MDRSYFYEASKTGLVFFLFFYDCCQILQSLCFYRKEKNERKEKKVCMGLVQPATKPAQLQEFSLGKKRSPPGEGHSN
jgi:hypothetical protein